MRCRYCFYLDEAAKREEANYGRMSLETLETIVQKALAQAEGALDIGFQGGEPTLAGLDFYKNLIEIEKRHNHKNLPIHHAIQTNGLAIDSEWAAFLAENQFLVGLSLDGHKDIHDQHRLDISGKGTHTRVIRAAQTLRRAGAEFNILVVVTRQLAKSIGKATATLLGRASPISSTFPASIHSAKRPAATTIPSRQSFTASSSATCSTSGTAICSKANGSTSVTSLISLTCCAAARLAPAAWLEAAATNTSLKPMAASIPATSTCWTNTGWATYKQTASRKSKSRGIACSSSRARGTWIRPVALARTAPYAAAGAAVTAKPPAAERLR